MKITLVTASFNDLVHGTFNDKKTGCGINLMKPETASRYHRGGEMSYLGELTCEKCKARIAKEMIKADSKEMKAWLKEEKLRAKKGMDDEGLVQLSELEVRPTSVAPPEPEPPAPEPPVIPASNVQTNADNPAYSDDLAQFAIKKPQPEPEQTVQEESDDDFLAQFAIKKPTEEINTDDDDDDDFLAQFAIKKPTEEINTDDDDDDDFLAQFSVSSPTQEESYEEEPSAPPVIDDISDALSAMQNSPLTSYKESEPEKDKSDDDILSMFAIDNSSKNDTTDYINSGIMDDDDESIFDSMTSDDDADMNSTSEWDIIANQLFSDVSSEEQPETPVIENISVPEIEDIAAPALNDIPVSEIKEAEIPAFDDISVPKIEDIEIPALDDISVPEIEDIEIPALDDISVPEIEDVETPALDDISIPETKNVEIPEPVAPVKSAPKQTAPPPVQQAPKAVVPPVQPMPQSVTPPPVQPVHQSAASQPIPPIQPMPAPAGMAMGQIVTVPQLTGYDPNGIPIYTYMQMILQGYDQNGQPIMMPMPQNMMGMGMPMQMPVQPAQPAQPEYSSLNKNSRLQAVLDSLDEPVSEKDMTIGQKIAAAEAAKGSPVSANVSKIATNQHTKSTSQAFINAISESKDDTQSLTETQGLKPKTMVLDSIEDVLSQLGDDSLKKKKEAESKIQQNVPKYEEFKTPTRTSSSSFSRPLPSSSRTSAPNMSDMPLTKSQQKALEKQQKIDAKFQKKMAKRK